MNNDFILNEQPVPNVKINWDSFPIKKFAMLDFLYKNFYCFQLFYLFMTHFNHR